MTVKLVNCKVCGKEVSQTAKTCPHCGEKSPAPMPKGCGIGCLVIIIISAIVLGIAFISDLTRDTEKEEAACMKDLQCWGEKHQVSAIVKAQPQIERLAQYSYEWTDGTLEPKFSHYRWKDSSQGVITYIGDKIKFQNGFGAWQNYYYECDYDPKNESIIDVRVKAGRL